MRSWKAGFIGLAALVAGYATGCGGNDPNPNAINPIPSGYSAGDNITPANGTTVGLADSPLEVGVRTPALNPDCSADPDCAAAAAGGLSVGYEVVSDNATPGNASDDVVLGTDAQTGVPFDSYTSTTVDLARVPDGAGIEARVSVTGTDSEGTEHSVDGSAEYVYEGEAPGPRIAYCIIYTSIASNNSISIGCAAEDASGVEVVGDAWEASCPSIPGGCGAEEGGVYTNNGMADSEIGIHNIDVRALVGSVWTPWKTIPTMVSSVECEANVQYTNTSGSPETMHIRANQDYCERLAATCFPEFNSANVDEVIPMPHTPYGLERNIPDDGQTGVDTTFDCLNTASHATTDEAPLLPNWRYAESRLPEERLDEISEQPKQLVQIIFFQGYY